MTMILSGSGTGTVGVPNSATAQNSTSGTSIDFTGIPAGIKRITVMFNGVSISSTAFILVQVGSGSVTTTGYSSTGVRTTTVSTATNGFVILANVSGTIYGSMTISTVSGDTWVSSHSCGSSAPSGFYGGGKVSLSGALDRVRITTSSGTDTFTAGSINILYE